MISVGAECEDPIIYKNPLFPRIGFKAKGLWDVLEMCP
jgi:hypothetical protein